MNIFERKTPLEKEWETLRKKEARFFKSRLNKKDSVLNQALEDKVPATLQGKLDVAFAKAFLLVFEKGTDIIEKTYKKEELEQQFQINQFADQVKQNRKSIRTFSKKAGSAGAKNLALSGASGVGLGLLGVGLPDIPLFIGMILKDIYEIALNYGYRYDTPKEKYFILQIIRGALTYGEEVLVIDEEINHFMKTDLLPAGYDLDTQIQETSQGLSKELLYMKFLQGIPLVGAVGGAYDAVYMKRIHEYASLKYQRRFLNDYPKHR